MTRRKLANRSARWHRVKSIAMAGGCAIVSVFATASGSVAAEPPPANAIGLGLFESELIESGLIESGPVESGLIKSGLPLPGEIQPKQRLTDLIDTALFESEPVSKPPPTVVPTSALGDQQNPKDQKSAHRVTRVIVGMPQLAGQTRSELRLQPNIQVESDSGRRTAFGHPHTNSEQASVAGQGTVTAQSMFLSRTPEDQQAIENQRITAPQAGVIREVSRDPFSLVSRSKTSRSNGYFPASMRGQIISSPSDFDPTVEELPPAVSEPDTLREDFGTILDGESVLYGSNSIDLGFQNPLTAREMANDNRPRSSLTAAAADRMIDGFRRSVNRIRSTRQRVDAGLGSILVPNAPLVLDTTQPLHQYRIRGDLNYGNDFPDRSEYLWASPQKGPGYRGSIDTQEFAFMFEVGNDAASVQTEFSVRAFDAEFGGGHAGAGDIRITQKLRLFDGKRWQVTQMMRVHTPSGNAGLGAGTGHVSLEPGVLLRWQQSCWTYWHGELEYRIPMGGDPAHSGDVLTYGFGVSSVWYETLTSAVIPTLELTSLNFLTGQKTAMFDTLPVDGESAIALHPGVRFAWDRGGDLGMTEFGISSGIPMSDLRYFDGFLRFELRVSR